MKKSVMLMAGLLTVALAASAQAAGNTMFAVQNTGGTQDMAAITDTGDVNAVGSMTIGGKFAGGLGNVPLSPTAVAITGPAGVFHVASAGNVGASTMFIAQHVAGPATAAGTDYINSLAPSFSFYRVNRNTASHPTAPLAYAAPKTDNYLGFFNFGAINWNKDPNSGTSRKNIVQFLVAAESNWTLNASNNYDSTPTYFSWANTTDGTIAVEKMRLSSTGNLGIGTTVPTSKLQVVGLQVSDSGPPAGLTSGAFYRTSAGVVMVVP